MADYDSAWTYFQLSLQASQKHKDGRGQWTNAVNLGNTAIVFRALHDSTRYLGEAKNVLETVIGKMSEDPSVSRRDKIAARTTLGTLCFFLSEGIGPSRSNALPDVELKASIQKLQMLGQAENNYQKALDLVKHGGFRREQAVLLKNLAEVYENTADYADALQAMRESRRILIREGDEELLWRVENSMAKFLGTFPQNADSIQNPDVLDLYRQAMNRLELLPVDEQDSEEALSDRTERRDLYFNAAAAMLRSGRVREAFETNERGREKNIADMLSRHPPALRKERHKIAWGNLRYVRSMLSEKRRQLLSESAGTGGIAVLERLRKEEQSLFEDYKNQLQNLESEDFLLAYLAGAMKMDLDSLRFSLPLNGAVLSYLTGEDSTLIWFVSRDTLLSKTVVENRSVLQNRIDRLLDEIQKDSVVQVGKDSLFRLILGPVEGFFGACKSIIIIPDGVLWNAPFDFLLNSDDRLDGLTITYAPSLAYFALCREKRKINQETGVLVADLQDQTLAECMKAAGISGKALLGPSATEKGFKEALEQTDIVQTEKWILGYGNDPLASSVVLNPGMGEDGFCRADELFGLDARANLVFLPPYSKGRSQAGYPEIFFYSLLYAGVPSLISSQWPVDISAKRIFWDAFYRTIQTRSFAEAENLAVQAVRSVYSSAKSWAAFRMVGFPGMNTQERIAFAEENQIRTILQGRYFEEKGEFADAVSTFEKSLVLTETIRDSASVPKIHQEIVRVAMKGKLWSKAVQYQKKLIDFNRKSGNDPGLMNGLKNLVFFSLQNGDYPGAADAKSRQIELLKKTGKIKELAAAYEEMAFIESGLRRYDESVSLIEEAFRAYDGQNDGYGRARALVLKGRFYLEGDDAWKAKACLERGVGELDSVLAFDPHNDKIRYDLASGIQLLGLVYEKLAQYGEAVALQQKGIALFETLNRPLQVAQGYQYLANLYWKTGNYRMAFSFQNRTLDSLRSSENKKLLAMAYGTLGLIHLSLGDLVQAKISEEKALDIVNQEASLQADRAALLKNRGLIAFQEKNFEQAYGYFLQAEAIDSSLGLKAGLAYDYRNLGNVLIENRREKEGLGQLHAALELSLSLGDVRNVVQCWYGLAQGYALTGDVKTALAALDSGLAETEGFAFPDLQWRLNRQRGKLLIRIGKEREALDDFQKAIDIVEAMRGELKIEAFQQGFFDDKMDLYEDVIRLLLNSGRPEEAFHFAERAKSRNFVDILANQSVAISETQGGEMLQKERQAYQAVQEAQDQLSRSLQTRGEITVEVQAQRRFWSAELNKRRKTYQDVLAEIQAGNPELASFVSVDPWNTEKIQLLLPDSAALIEYFVSQNSLFIWIMKKNALRWKELQIPSIDFRTQVGQFRDAIQAHLSIDPEARKLYGWLIEPVVGELSEIRHIIVVPHGVLHYLPFSALENGQGEYLAERFSISNAPSATVLGFCLEKASRMKFDANGAGGVFAVSNPDLGDARYDLPFAEKEVKSLRRTFDNVFTLFGGDATVRGVERNLAAAKSVVHFACHAEYTPEAPLFSALRLTPEPGDDGRLNAQAIFSLPFQCGLVTLSACETGLASVTQGDEIVGLARSFIFAGAPSVMTSLWKVDDLATAVLMKRFYRNMKAGYSKAESLRKAQMLVKNAVNAHPAAWAAFGLTGDFR
jgi:CHAT domain-containing protein